MTMLQDDSTTHLTTTTNTTHLASSSSSTSNNKSNNLNNSITIGHNMTSSSTTITATTTTSIPPPSATSSSPSPSPSPPSPPSSHPPSFSSPPSPPPSPAPLPPILHNPCPITTKIVQSLFGSTHNTTSAIVSDWTCSYHLVSGRLYAGSSGLYFYSNLFGFERKVMIKMSDIGNVGRVGQTSVGVETMGSGNKSGNRDGGGGNNGGEEFVFKGFHDREEVFLIVNDLWRRYGSGVAVSGSGRERMSGSIHAKSSSGGGGGSSGGLFKRRHLSLPAGLGLSNGEKEGGGGVSTTMIPTVVSEEEEDEGEGMESLVATMNSETITAAVVDGSVSKTTTNEEEEEEEGEERNMTWDEHCYDIEKNYSEFALDQFSLACSISQFKSQFLSDDSPHSIPHYQRTVINDTDLNTTSWKLKKSTQQHVQTRSISFVHKVNAPVGPNSTRGLKRQRLYDYHNNDGGCNGTTDLTSSDNNNEQQQQQRGLILTTTTTLKDVYNADCFHVSDVWIVTTSKDDNNGDGAGIILTVKFKVVFVKSTLWKSVIQSKTKSDMISWYKGYAELMTRAVGAGAAPTRVRMAPSSLPSDRNDNTTTMIKNTTMMNGLTTLGRWMMTTTSSLTVHRLGMSMVGLLLLLLFLSLYYRDLVDMQHGNDVVSSSSSCQSSSLSYQDQISILEETINDITKHHEKQMNDVMTRLMELETIVKDMRRDNDDDVAVPRALSGNGVCDTKTPTSMTTRREWEDDGMYNVGV